MPQKRDEEGKKSWRENVEEDKLEEEDDAEKSRREKEY